MLSLSRLLVLAPPSRLLPRLPNTLPALGSTPAVAGRQRVGARHPPAGKTWAAAAAAVDGQPQAQQLTGRQASAGPSTRTPLRPRNTTTPAQAVLGNHSHGQSRQRPGPTCGAKPRQGCRRGHPIHHQAPLTQQRPERLDQVGGAAALDGIDGDARRPRGRTQRSRGLEARPHRHHRVCPLGRGGQVDLVVQRHGRHHLPHPLLLQLEAVQAQQGLQSRAPNAGLCVWVGGWG